MILFIFVVEWKQKSGHDSWELSHFLMTITPYTTIDFNCDNPCSDMFGGGRQMCFFLETITAHVQVALGRCTVEEGPVPTTEHTVKKALWYCYLLACFWYLLAAIFSNYSNNSATLNIFQSYCFLKLILVNL